MPSNFNAELERLVDAYGQACYEYGENGGNGPAGDEEYAALVAHASREEWLPIESAPKDGKKMLGFNGAVPVIMFFCDDRWCDGSYWRQYPTHWMPLPAPPLREIAEGEG